MGPVICDAWSGRLARTKFDDFWPEWDGILTDPTRRFLRRSRRGLPANHAVRKPLSVIEANLEQFDILLLAPARFHPDAPADA